MRSGRRSQRDLFEQETTLVPLQPVLRSKLAPLLQVLLTEAAGLRQLAEGAGPNGREGGDDQDHA